MKYKVGDKVRVRKDLIEGEIYDKSKFVLAMSPLLGKIATIGYVFAGVCKYHLSENPTGEYWTDEMLEDVEEEFKLPDNGRWCIKATKENISILGDYWDKGCGLSKIYSLEDTFRYGLGKYWCSYNQASGNLLFSESPGNNHIIYSKPEGLLEITFDQFKKYVLKEIESTPVKEEAKVNTLEQSRESLLEEAKRRYPVGTKFKSASSGKIYVVHKRHEVSLFISSRGDWVLVDIDDIGNMEHVYYDGKWAEIVESPTVQQKFTPNDLPLKGGWYPFDTTDHRYTLGIDPITDSTYKKECESKSSTNESDFPIISTKRIINFSQLT